MASFEYLVKNPDLLHREWEPKKFDEFFQYVAIHHPLIIEYVCSIQRPSVNSLTFAAEEASVKGNLKNLQYLIGEGVKPNIGMLISAIRANNEVLIKTIYKYVGKFWEKKYSLLLKNLIDIVRYSSYEIFLFFINEGLDYKKLAPPNQEFYIYGDNKKFLAAVGVVRDVRNLQYLVNLQYTYDSDTMYELCISFYFEDTLNFYLNLGVPITNKCIKKAITNQNIKFLQYCKNKGIQLNDNYEDNFRLALVRGYSLGVELLMEEGIHYSWLNVGSKISADTPVYWKSPYKRCLNFFRSNQYNREEWKEKALQNGFNDLYTFLCNL